MQQSTNNITGTHTQVAYRAAILELKLAERVLNDLVNEQNILQQRIITARRNFTCVLERHGKLKVAAEHEATQ